MSGDTDSRAQTVSFCLHPVPGYGLTVNPMSLNDDLPNWIPASCTLPSEQQPLRVAEFDDLFRDCVIRVDRAAPTSLRLTLNPGDEVAARVRDLVARETQCCSFFTFDLSPAPHGLHVQVQVPPEQIAVLDAFTARAERLAA
jgi:hypothetical protein